MFARMNLLTLCKVGSACVLPDKWFYDLVCGNFKIWYYITHNVLLPYQCGNFLYPLGLLRT